MLSRVQGFCRAHPSDDPGTIGLVTRLDERLARAKTLNEQAISGTLTAHTSVVSKDDQKVTIRGDFRVLEALSDLLVMDDPTFNASFAVPGIREGHWAFLAASRVALTHAAALKDKFAAHDIKETFLEDLTASVTTGPSRGANPCCVPPLRNAERGLGGEASRAERQR